MQTSPSREITLTLKDEIGAKPRDYIIRSARLWIAIVNVVLIFFSSTKTAGDASENAYAFYTAVFPLAFSERNHLLHLLADKSVHFLLFFSLGVWVYRSLALPPAHNLALTLAACLLVGTASEVMQLFTGRDASVADVILNAASGAMGALSLHAPVVREDGREKKLRESL